MPKSWYSNQYNKIHNNDTADEITRKQFYQKIAAEKKPYFMRYIYPDQMNEYNKYIHDTNQKCRMKYGLSVQQLIEKPDKTEDENDFIYWYNFMMPVSQHPSVMNRLCKMVENEFDGYISQIKASSDFDYNILKCEAKYTSTDYNKIKHIYEKYLLTTKEFQLKKNHTRSDADDDYAQILMLKQNFQRECELICSNEEQLCDILLDLCYRSEHSKHFVWEMCADTIIKNLLRLNNNTITYLYKDGNGTISYNGETFSVGKKVLTNDDT